MNPALYLTLMFNWTLLMAIALIAGTAVASLFVSEDLGRVLRARSVDGLKVIGGCMLAGLLLGILR
jgi:hypothetical protein